MGMRQSIAITPYPGQPKKLRTIKMSVLSTHSSGLHLSRRIYHMLAGLMCFSLYAFILDKSGALWALSLVGGTLVAFDLLRMRFGKVNEFALKTFGKFMRREELRSISGNTYYVAGLIIITLIFPQPIVLLCVLYLALGDPIAAMAGITFGKHKLWSGKSLEGALANFLITAIASFAFGAYYLTLGWNQALLLALLGGFTSTLAELCPLKINDNFTIPVLSASMLYLASLGIPFL